MKKIFYLILILFMTTIENMDAKKDNHTYVLIETTKGNIKVLLYDETPQHRDNFIKLANEGFFNETLFHRVIKDFMIQGGDPDSKNAPAGKSLGTGGPSYTIPAEFVYPQHFHKRGALSAARQADQVNPEKRSSGSQFYIVWGSKMSNGQLDGMEQQVNQGKQKKIFDRMTAERQKEILELRKSRNQEGLVALQEELIKKSAEEAKSSPNFKYTEAQRNAYTTIGGTPFLDNEYTVFGEVVEGLDIVEKIQSVKTGNGDRPEEDVKMKISVVKN